ncbi:MAG: transcription antitermination factor NusB [Treponema sp.]|jgi:transcription antitermination factor nusB|uniref:Transcription antitermination protein NusB n=1 Tax=Treponema vincentii TaxID=69710 RepID=A0A6P1Y2S7_9SPIR|nr:MULTISPECIES: transcription antitermination factor NusB [Treponema]QHX44137.1 transcription antitermination factor NusB [Treponema vincentii]UTC52939.1 transcription antitermination factor NusB [Treponema sp. OMZ 803]UTC55362.1 transcription antitermination factor NusB [Treponema sp. OMZ 906]
MAIGRRRGRILAFQALFAWDAGSLSPDDLLRFPWAERTSKEVHDEDLLFSQLLFLGTVEHINKIDTLITKNLENWDFNRLKLVDKAILRLSTYSLLFQQDTDPRIVINEAVTIARTYGTDDSFKFVNAVLDSIKRECLDCSYEKDKN